MTNQDRKVIYRMFIFIMRGIFVLVKPNAYMIDDLRKSFNEFYIESANWLRGDDTHGQSTPK